MSTVEVQKTDPATQVENLHAVQLEVSHFKTKHLVLWTLDPRLWNHIEGTLRKELSTNSKWATLTKSRIIPCQILSCLSMSLPSVQTVTKENEVVMRDWIENRSTCLTATYKKRINSRQSGIFTVPAALWDYVMLFSIASIELQK